MDLLKDMDEPVNIDAEPQEALRVLLNSPPLAEDESAEEEPIA
jgi:hypothetical protein